MSVNIIDLIMKMLFSVTTNIPSLTNNLNYKT